MKQAFITIQIDDITTEQFAELDDILEAALSDFRRKRIVLSLQRLETPPLPLEEKTE